MRLTDSQKRFNREKEEAETRRIELRLEELRTSKRVSANTFLEINQLEDELLRVKRKSKSNSNTVFLFGVTIFATFFVLVIIPFTNSIDFSDRFRSQDNSSIAYSESHKAVETNSNGLSEYEIMVKNKIGTYAGVVNPITEKENIINERVYSDETNALDDSKKYEVYHESQYELLDLKDILVTTDFPKVMTSYNNMRIRRIDIEIERIELLKKNVIENLTTDEIDRYNNISNELVALEKESHNEVIRVFENIDMTYWNNEESDYIEFTFGKYE